MVQGGARGWGRRQRSRGAGVLWGGAEVAVTVGLVLLLLVVHQLWWTNRQARQGAERQVQALEREWAASEERSPDDLADVPSEEPDEQAEEEPGSGDGAGDGPQQPVSAAKPPPKPDWDQAYAVLTIPRLGIRVPVAQGVSKSGVLNKGYVGHYPGTAQPGGKGNFALAGHRNTHGEPFRYINRLRSGDQLKVETKAATYTYTVGRTLAQTSPRDGGVIAKVPQSQVKPGAGYSEPGYYITLTTCTPEYTSKYRLVVWGKLTGTRPR
ncbi:class E sortase [Streptomyces sp. NBC_01304]|nr:class E sortase [Streptomyces sp. NBC_01304]